MKAILKFKCKFMAAALLSACLATSTACSEDDGPAGQDVDIVIPPAYQRLVFPATGGESPLLVKSSIDLEAVASADWVTAVRVESTSQKMRKFNVVCQPSASGVTDSAQITLSAASGYSGVVKVVRLSGAVLSLVSDAEVTVGPEYGEIVKIVVRANEAPVFSSSESWVTSPSPSEADGNYTFNAIVANNLTTADRSATLTISNSGGSVSVIVTQSAGPGLDDSAMPSDAMSLISKIYAGINIGNTMECPAGEGDWSGEKVNADYVEGLKALGFNAVRIPCAWHSHLSDDKKYTIDPAWISRVKEVVDLCVGRDMYVMLNIHWDSGWLEDNIFDASKKSAIVAEQKAIWTQIATAFKDYDEHLFFAGCNEPGMNETINNTERWKTEPDALKRYVEYAQTFIDAVRATGGNNALRCLVFQGLGASISVTCDHMSIIPTDVVEGRLIAELHYYEPYQWAIMGEDASWGKTFWYWGMDNHKSGSNHNATYGEEDFVKSQFAEIKKRFVDKGIPVVIGEYSTRIRTGSEDPSEEFDAELFQKSRAYYNEVVTREAKNHGCAPFFWETGAEVNRKNGSAKLQYAIDGIMRGAKDGKYPF